MSTMYHKLDLCLPMHKVLWVAGHYYWDLFKSFATVIAMLFLANTIKYLKYKAV